MALLQVTGKEDLLTGTNNSHIATLVERHTRFVMLLKIEQGHGNRGRRAHETCAQTAAAAAPLLDLFRRIEGIRPR